MDAPTAAVIHFYDTTLHAIACGVHGLEHRSTKHSRHVTCRACVAARRAAPGATASAPPVAGATAP